METSTPAYIPSKTPAQPVLSPIQPTAPQSAPQSTQSAEPVDYGALNLARSIALQESSKDGQTPNYTATGDAGTSYGAYQWNNGKAPLQPGQLPTNFTSAAKQYGLDPTDFSPENQDKVAYAQVKALKDQGLTPEQIAASWNAGMGHINDWQTHKGTTVINGQNISYDTPAYVQGVQNHYQQLAQSSPPPTQDQPQTTQGQTLDAPPSVGGFLGNVVKSGANFVGNLGNAALHPLQTVQNIGSMAVGGLQELGGQQNQNTQAFDNLKQYFAQRYGGAGNIGNTMYTDPVGFLADISTILGVGGGALGLAGKGAELAGLGTRAAEATSAIGATEASGAAGALSGAAQTLGKGAELTNPLSLPIKGASKLLTSGPVSQVLEGVAGQASAMKPALMEDIIKNPQNYTEEQITSVTRANVADQVASDFNAKEAQLSETGSAYNSIRESGATPPGYENVKNVPPANAIPVQQNFLEDQLRKSANVDIQDGNIVKSGSSSIRATKDVNALQQLFNTWKPEFQKGYLTPEEFLNLRQDLGSVAKYDREFSASRPVENVAAAMRSSLNDTYRGGVPGLTELDATYGPQAEELASLRKGLFDKDGNLLPSAINKIANATNKGRDATLAKLEEISPGITAKIKTMRNIEQIQTLKENKIGTFPSASLKAGGALYGLATGDMHILAVSLATMFIAEPDIAIPILRTIGYNKQIFGEVTSNLTKFLNAGSVVSATQGTQANSTQDQSPQMPPQQTNPDSSSPPTTGTTDTSSQLPTTSLDSLATSKHFNLAAARKAGYDDQTILSFLQSQK